MPYYARVVRRVLLLLLVASCARPAPPIPEDDDSATPDPGPALDCYRDRDGDGAGDLATPWPCQAGSAPEAGDCDDLDAAVGLLAPETCDGEDDDCDGLIDDNPVDTLPFWRDEDGDGWGVDGSLLHGCTVPVGGALAGGDCDDDDDTIHPGAPESCDPIDQDCDGLSQDGLGVSADCPIPSCLATLLQNPGAPSGPYWMTLPSGTVVPVACDMVSSGGGWTLAFLRNSASTGNQGGFGAGEVGLDALARLPGETSASAVAALGWLDLNGLDWGELQLASYAGAGETYRSWVIPRSSLRINFGEDGYFLWGEEGYWWCGGHASYTDAGVGAVNNPVGATADCKGHGSLGSGWDFSESDGANAGLTLCGADGSYFLHATWGGSPVYYGTPGGAQAIWVR